MAAIGLKPLLSASPASLHAHKLKPFPWHPGRVDAAAQLKAFDRVAGRLADDPDSG